MSPGAGACIVRVEYNISSQTWGYALMDKFWDVVKDFGEYGYLTAGEALAAAHDDPAFGDTDPP